MRVKHDAGFFDQEECATKLQKYLNKGAPVAQSGARLQEMVYGSCAQAPGHVDGGEQLDPHIWPAWAAAIDA